MSDTRKAAAAARYRTAHPSRSRWEAPRVTLLDAGRAEAGDTVSGEGALLS